MENSEKLKTLRVMFITQEDPFYIKLFFEEFLKHYSDKVIITGVVVCSTMGKKSMVKLVKQMYGFYGLVNFLRVACRYILVKIKRNTLNTLFSSYNIPVYKTNDINSDVFINYWKQQGLDVIISVAAPRIFKEKLLTLPKWGCINIHHAKVPNYRGMMPTFWQMYHSEKAVGITVHKMNPKIDEGEIILQREISIEEDESLDNLIKRTKQIGAHCMFEALELIKNNRVKYLPNFSEEGSYFSFPTKEDVCIFRQRGKRLL